MNASAHARRTGSRYAGLGFGGLGVGGWKNIVRPGKAGVCLITALLCVTEHTTMTIKHKESYPYFFSFASDQPDR